MHGSNPYSSLFTLATPGKPTIAINKNYLIYNVIAFKCRKEVNKSSQHLSNDDNNNRRTTQ